MESQNLNMTDEAKTLDEVQSELHCGICQDYFKEAHTLSCSHSFCLNCITLWRHNHTDCPICRREIYAITPSRALNNIVAAFIKRSNPTVLYENLQNPISEVLQFGEIGPAFLNCFIDNLHYEDYSPSSLPSSQTSGHSEANSVNYFSGDENYDEGEGEFVEEGDANYNDPENDSYFAEEEVEQEEEEIIQYEEQQEYNEDSYADDEHSESDYSNHNDYSDYYYDTDFNIE